MKLKNEDAKLLFIFLPGFLLLLPAVLYLLIALSSGSIGKSTVHLICFFEQTAQQVAVPGNISGQEYAQLLYNSPIPVCDYSNKFATAYVMLSPVFILLMNMFLPYYLYKKNKEGLAGLISLFGLLFAGNVLLLILVIMQAIAFSGMVG